MLVEYQHKNVEVNCPAKVADTLVTIGPCGRGRFAYVYSHVSGIAGVDGCIRPTVSDICFHMRPNYRKYLKRRFMAISDLVAWSDVLTSSNLEARLLDRLLSYHINLPDVFKQGRHELLSSIERAMPHDSNGFCLGNEACYCHKADWRLHLVTEDTMVQGRMVKRPVINDGRMMIHSILLPFYIVRRKVIVPGIWRETNSSALTLMKRAIEQVIGLPEWKAFSLCQENYSHMTMDARLIYGAIPDRSTQAYDLAIVAICGLDMLPMTALEKDANTLGIPQEISPTPIQVHS